MRLDSLKKQDLKQVGGNDTFLIREFDKIDLEIAEKNKMLGVLSQSSANLDDFRRTKEQFLQRTRALGQTKCDDVARVSQDINQIRNDFNRLVQYVFRSSIGRLDFDFGIIESAPNFLRRNSIIGGSGQNTPEEPCEKYHEIITSGMPVIETIIVKIEEKINNNISDAKKARELVT